MHDSKVFKNRVSEKLAIAQVIDSTDAGGAEQIAIQLANRFAELGFASHLLVTRKLGALSEQIDSAVHLLVLNRHHVIEARAIRQVIAYIRNQGIQILHAHGRTSAYWCAAWKQIGNLNMRIVFHDHTGSYFLQPRWKRRINEFLDWLILRSVNGVVGVSMYHVKRNLRVLSSFDIPVTLIQNGIKLTDFENSHPSLNGFCIIQTANVTSQKGYLHVADIGAHLVSFFKEFRWLCIGALADKEYFSRVTSRLSEKDLQNKICFLGTRIDVCSLLSQATIGVLTSDDEGMPLALLEYMAAGLPVVVTDVGECRKVVDDAKCGFVVPRGKNIEFAEAISWLFQNPDQARIMGERGRIMVKKYYSVEVMLKHLIGFYSKILSKNIR